jgi:hypothetical protein
MADPISFDPFLGWVDITDPNNIPPDARVIGADDLLRYENFAVAAKNRINELADVPTNDELAAMYGPDAQALSGKVMPLLAAFEGVPATAYGHSYVANQNQTATTGWTGRVANRLRTAPLTNYGVQGYTMAQIAQRILTTWTPGARGLVMLMGVMNDLQKYNTDSAGPATLREGLRAALAVLTSGAIYGANASCLVYNGAWTAGPTANVYGGVTKRTTTIGDHVDFSFNGDSAYLLTQFVGDGSGGTVTITRSGDGSQAAQAVTNGYTTQLTTYSGGSTPGVIRLSGFGAGPHSVRATLTAGTGFTVNGVIIPNPNAPTVAVVKEGPAAAYLAAPYNTNVSGGNAALTGTYEPAMDAAIANFPSVVATPNGGPTDWDAASMSGADGLHPNDKGSFSLANAAINALSAISWRDGLNWQGNAFTDTPTTPAYTTASATAPAVPTAAAVTGSQISVSWGQVADNGATISAYTVRYSAAGANSWTTFGTFGPTVTSTIITTGLTAGNSYDIQVSSTNAAGQSAWSATATATAGTAVVIYTADTFNKADASTLGVATTGGQTWAVAGSGTTAYAISGNQAKVTSVTEATAPGDAYIDDGQVNGTIKVTIPDTLTSKGITFRGSGTNNSTAYLFYRSAATTLTFAKRTGVNAYTTIQAATGQPTAAAGDVLSVVMNGTSFTFKLNGATVMTVTDATYQTGTRHGIWSGNISGGTVSFFDEYSHTN